MAINDRSGNGAQSASGTGPGETEARPAGFDAPPHAQEDGASGPGTADPTRGGCLKLGWGCLPVLAVAALLPTGLLF